MSTVIDSDERERSLKTVGTVSYLLHLIVAVGAVLPGVQASVALLIVAFIIDVVKKDEAAGTWQASHFSWRIRSVLWAGGLYIVTSWLWLLFFIPGWIAWG
ncbi:putative membrane protein [Methylibium sp. T29]|nr:putative membrane protein [Methylibium sp. T29]EWS59217.1 putative membrane protein [Methylibium sp. T29-B]